MGRGVTASNAARCSHASEMMVRFVLALRHLAALSDERSTVVHLGCLCSAALLVLRVFKQVTAPAPPRALQTGALPNWSLERTSTGMPLGLRGAHCHHSPRRPSAIPAPARSAQTL